jgi:hypothetical protein
MNLDGSGFGIVRGFVSATEGASPGRLTDLALIPLPVEWLTFDATKVNQSVLLTWKTAQEENTDRFEIERSAFGTAYNKIGTINAAGNTTSMTSYSFTDANPADGINYYRLRQRDKDGKYTYSKIVAVAMSSPGKVVIAPNPVVDQLNIILPGNNSYNAIRVLDASGKLVLQKSIAASTTALQLDVHSLSNGWYVMQLEGKQTERQVFLKQ